VRSVIAVILALGIAGCPPPEDEWVWDLPEGFPLPRVPDDNPMSAAKVDLGRFLFYDTRLSANETQSCGSCHQQQFAFTDGLANAVGSTMMIHPRSSMGLTNVGYQSTLTWANPVVRTLEDQAQLPMFGDSPIVELGLGGMEAVLLERLRADAEYPGMFAAAFPDEADPISVASVVRAIGAFERTMISGNSPYDRFLRGETAAMSESALRGMELFFDPVSLRFECFHCHGGFNFTASQDHSGIVISETAFFNNGLYNVDGRGGYPPDNTGLAEFTGEPDDMGRFKPPTLRNIELTAPYMHDGSIATLEEVIDMYSAGGRNLTTGMWPGDGRENPYKNIFVPGFDMTDQERDDMLAFLRSLTDPGFIADPRFSDPFR
jgi:cytochrome c peroxidase